MEKMAKVAAKAGYRTKLKRVQSVKYTIGDDEKQVKLPSFFDYLKLKYVFLPPHPGSTWMGPQERAK